MADLIDAVFGTGDEDASRLVRQVDDETRRAVNSWVCQQIVHGESPCDCAGDVCVGVVLFG